MKVIRIIFLPTIMRIRQTDSNQLDLNGNSKVPFSGNSLELKKKKTIYNKFRLTGHR